MAWLRDGDGRLYRDAVHRAVLAACAGVCCGACLCPDGTPRTPCCCLDPSDPEYCGDNAELCECACVCPNGGGLLPPECCNGTWAPGDPRCNCSENAACCAAGALAYFDRRFPRVATLNLTGGGASSDCRSCSCAGGSAAANGITEAYRFVGLSLVRQIVIPASDSGNGCGDSEFANTGNGQPAGGGLDYTFPRILPCQGIAHDCGATAQVTAFGNAQGIADLSPTGVCTATGSASIGSFGVAISAASITHSLPMLNANGQCAGSVNSANITVPGGGCAGQVNIGSIQCTSTTSSHPGCIGKPCGDAQLAMSSSFFPVKFCPGARLAAPRDRAPVLRPRLGIAPTPDLRRSSIAVPRLIVPGCGTCGQDGRTGGGSTL